jgi:hypothetical protein
MDNRKHLCPFNNLDEVTDLLTIYYINPLFANETAAVAFPYPFVEHLISIKAFLSNQV